MDRSDSIQKLAAALVKVQSALRPIKRNAENPFFKSSYVDLAALSETVLPLLTANGLAVIQGGDGPTLETMLVHESGEWISTHLPLHVGQKPQEMGSSITYARRYALAALVGAVSEGEDDDGNAASHPTSRPASAATPAPRPVSPGPPPPTAPAATVPSGGGSPASPGDALEVTDFKVKEGIGKDGKPYKRFVATFSNGVTASTFDTNDGALLDIAHQKSEPVIVGFQKSGNFTNIVSVEEFPF